MFAFVPLVASLVVYSFVIERVIIGDPAWLPLSESNIVISQALFGTYDQDAYGGFLLLLFALATIAGVAVGFALLRRFVPIIAARGDIHQGDLPLRLVLDPFLAIPFAIAVSSAIAWWAGVDDLLAFGVFGLGSYPAYILWAGFVTGSAAAKGGVGLWWLKRETAGRGAR